MLSVGNLVQKAWFHLYNIQGEAKVLGQKTVYWSPRTGGREKDLLEKGMRVLFGVTEMVYILIAVVIQLCIFVKNHYQAVHSKGVFLLYINYTSIKLNWIDLWEGEKSKTKKNYISLPFIILCKLFKLSWPHLLICITDNPCIAEFFKIIYVTWLPMVKSYFWVLVCIWLRRSVNKTHSLIAPRCWPLELPFIARVPITAMRFKMQFTYVCF